MACPLLQRFTEAASTFPERVALGTRDGDVRYDTLAAMAAGAATQLATRTRRGEHVCILSESTPEYAAAVYGCWAAGLVAIGLNPALRSKELARLVRHGQAVLLLADPAHTEVRRVEDALAGTVPVVSLGEITTPGELTAEVTPPGSDDLATIIYTSGTTGHPKGVMLSHGNLAANTESIQASLPIRPDDHALCVLPFQYSYGSSVLHTHLTVGATILLERSLMYPATVLERMETEKATSLAGVPSTFYLLLDRSDLGSHDLSSLRYVTQAGGRMDPEQIRRFRRLVPGADFFVMYGQTEASARLACLPAGELDRKLGSAGRAIPGVQLRIASESGGAVAAGDSGEVWARGDNVMQGYWSDPEEAASVLVDGWLRTGDIGRLDEEGYLFLEGRSRDFIKSGAYRIAPAEIEDVIRGVEGVTDVAVVGREDPVLGEAVHAHIVAPDADPNLERTIMRACSEHLPRFKLPKTIRFRDDFPRTASGKIRRHLL